MTDFTPADFDAYFIACHGVKPFGWQHELASRVLEQGWPEVLDLPTAAGKTAVIDVALFALAAQARLPPAERTAPRRTALVVDRRVVVDGAYTRAEKIRTALSAAHGGILQRVRDALLSYGGEQALQTALLRGGIWRDEAWARTPLQPALLVSTVDQIGSRLLHRGYGLSPSARPIHAGLLANDTLIILDEAHLSRPFEDTLTYITRYRKWAEEPLSAPFAVMRMSATHAGDRHDAFPPSPECVFGDACLKKRLESPKLVRCVKTKDKKDTSFVAACVSHACAFAAPGATVAVVVNRVLSARAIFEALRKQTETAEKPLVAEIVLLTGRSRPVARDALLETHAPRLMAGRTRPEAASQKPLIVVATQCVEAGADFDFDALVTECCPLDSLRQRLGRLNRIGDLPEAHALVVARADIAARKAEDPVYGAPAHASWRWLLQQEADRAPVDLSASALRVRLPDDLPPLLARSPNGPLIFPTYCDLWVQTDPEARPSPDPAVFLHGPQRGEPDVQLVWREDLDGIPPDFWLDVVELCPPATGETLSVRISTAKRWLSPTAEAADEVDVEGVLQTEKTETASLRPFCVWPRADRSDPLEIRPGDTLVIPSSYGGCDAFGWAPDSRERVEDLAVAAYKDARRLPTLRIYPGERQFPAPARDAILAVAHDTENAESQIQTILQEHGLWPEKGAYAVLPYPGDHGWAVCPKRRWFEQADALGSSSISDRDGAVTLSWHTAQVSGLARLYAERCGLPPLLADALAIAGETHDWGKADPRFQALLYGDRIEALRRKTLLAKSVPLSEKTRETAKKSSGYPSDTRHELLSVRLLEALPTPPPEADLVKHLIATHHGHGRPFAPASNDTAPVSVSFTYDGQRLTASSATGLDAVDSGGADRFWRLIRRFGWWGLPYLEALLRLADHRASEHPDPEVYT